MDNKNQDYFSRHPNKNKIVQLTHTTGEGDLI